MKRAEMRGAGNPAIPPRLDALDKERAAMSKENKARITYRFDGQGRRVQLPQEPRREPQVIPLNGEEFRVMEDEEAARSGSAPREAPQHRAEEEAQARRGRAAPVILNEYTSEFGAYVSPFDEETERVERIIRESQRTNGETGFAEGAFGRAPAREEPLPPPGGADAYASGHDEQYREPFANGYEGYRYEQRPAGPSYDWGEPHSGARYVKASSTPPWTRIVLSVFGAVATGVLFGFLVLSMFSDHALPFGLFGGGKAKEAAPESGGAAAAGAGAAAGDSAASGSSAGTGAGTAAGQAVAAGAQAGTEAAGNMAAVNLPGRSYLFLQNGIFSSAAAAQAAQAELKKKGYAAVSVAEPDGKTTVYAGFALQKEEAVKLSRKLQSDKLDVFVKAVNVPAAPKLKWTGKAGGGDLAAYFQQGDKLVQMIGALTVLHLGETKPSEIEAETLDAIRTAHQQWIAASAPVKSGVPDTVAPALQQMATALNTAVMSMDEYRKNVSASYLWQAQGALMQYVLAERSLLTELAAQ
jgi:stage II sporulation protein B